MDSLGDRMKRYEEAQNHFLVPRTPTIIRVDGRAFHTYTRFLAKPFDDNLITSMVTAGQRTAADMQGFKLGYHQSDEVSFLLTDYDNLETQPWFGGRVQKMASVAASRMTAEFNDIVRGWVPHAMRATFDARVFQLPEAEIANYFLWRARDWQCNSIQMFARSHMSHKDMQNKSTADLLDILNDRGLRWDHLPATKKNGTFFWPPTNDRLVTFLPSVEACYARVSEIVEAALPVEVDE